MRSRITTYNRCEFKFILKFALNVFCSIFFLLNFTYLSLCEEKISYHGYSLFRITPTTQRQLDKLLHLNRKSIGQLDFWLTTSAVNNSADVMVFPSFYNRLVQILVSDRIPYSILIPDLGKIIKLNEDEEVNVSSGYEFFSTYRSVDEINEYMEALVSEYPDNVQLIEIGSSFEERPLNLFRISNGSSTPKPAIWIQGGAHAREQIGPATVLFAVMKLVRNCKKEEIYELLNTFDWYILPLLNPDGYEYCKIDRLWRKTRSRYDSSKDCVGVDANRNWDIKWNDVSGSSRNPCSHNYAGPEVFSESETKAVSDFMLENLIGRLQLFLDFHSYSQRWLTPYGYTSKVPPNYLEQKSLAEKASLALEKVDGSVYSIGSTGNIMYTVTGGARDWVYDVIGAKYSYVVELRDNGKFGFLLPKRLILPTAVETWEGIKAMGIELRRIIRRTLK